MSTGSIDNDIGSIFLAVVILIVVVSVVVYAQMSFPRKSEALDPSLSLSYCCFWSVHVYSALFYFCLHFALGSVSVFQGHIFHVYDQDRRPHHHYHHHHHRLQWETCLTDHWTATICCISRCAHGSDSVLHRLMPVVGVAKSKMVENQMLSVREFWIFSHLMAF